MIKETHLGDGVYAVYSSGDVWLDCRAGTTLTAGPTGEPGICLERWVFDNLLEFRARCDVEFLQRQQDKP